MQNSTREFEFDFRKIFNVFKQNIAWLMIVVVIFGAISALFTTLFVAKTYSTSIRFYVYSDAQSFTSGTITSQQFSAADTHAYSAMDILSTKECYNEMGATGTGVSISTTKKSNAPIFTVVVSGTDKYSVCGVAENIRDNLPDYVYSITKIGKLTSYGFTGLDTVADGPNVVQNIVISSMVGFILAFIILFLRSILDTGIHDENDVKNFIEYPILGSIPVMKTDSDDKNSTKYEKSSN